MPLPIPPCEWGKHGPIEDPDDADSGFFDNDELTELLGNESSPGGVDVTFPESSCSTLTGFVIKWACYPQLTAFGSICKDGLIAQWKETGGVLVGITSPAITPYKGGSAPSGWAVMTAAEVVSWIWHEYMKARVAEDCGCEPSDY